MGHRQDGQPGDPGSGPLGLGKALLAFGFPLATIVSLVFLDAPIAMALLAGVCAAAFVSVLLGQSVTDIQTAAFAGMNRVLGAALMMILVGIMIAVWIQAGCVPTLLYYSLAILNPSAFIPLTFLICIVIGMTTGTSWGTAGTIGLALVGVSQSLGYPTGLTVGAIISGALIGEKTSPIAGTTILTAASTQTYLPDHIISMLNTTIPAGLIAFVSFCWLGYTNHHGSSAAQDLVAVSSGLRAQFHLRPLLVIPPLAVLLLSARRKPAIPVFLLGIALGGAFAIALQHHSLREVLVSAADGYVSRTGDARLDQLLSRGGAISMANTVYIGLFAGALAGIVDHQRALHELITAILRFATSSGSLIFSTTLACLALMLGGAGQYCTLTLPGIAFREAYAARDVHSSVLSRTMEDTGTLAGAIIPWDPAAVFYAAMFGISVFDYMPYAIISYLSPIIAVTFGFLGIGAFRRDQKVRPLVLRSA